MKLNKIKHEVTNIKTVTLKSVTVKINDKVSIVAQFHNDVLKSAEYLNSDIPITNSKSCKHKGSKTISETHIIYVFDAQAYRDNQMNGLGATQFINGAFHLLKYSADNEIKDENFFFIADWAGEIYDFNFNLVSRQINSDYLGGFRNRYGANEILWDMIVTKLKTHKWITDVVVEEIPYYNSAFPGNCGISFKARIPQEEYDVLVDEITSTGKITANVHHTLVTSINHGINNYDFLGIRDLYLDYIKTEQEYYSDEFDD